jgi:hypothetical protein
LVVRIREVDEQRRYIEKIDKNVIGDNVIDVLKSASKSTLSIELDRDNDGDELQEPSNSSRE